MRCRLRIRGRVQGVWYRASLREVALRNRIAGWVRNLPDGSVEAVLEGEQGQVRAVVEWCRRGPPGADVDDVKVTAEPGDEGGFRGFEILY